MDMVFKITGILVWVIFVIILIAAIFRYIAAPIIQWVWYGVNVRLQIVSWWRYLFTSYFNAANHADVYRWKRLAVKNKRLAFYSIRLLLLKLLIKKIEAHENS